MLAQVHSFVSQGIDPVACEVEVDASDEGETRVLIVGLPDAAVRESTERVRSAVLNSGYTFPYGRLLISLAPAHVRKEGPAFDLPIALGVLLAEKTLTTEAHRKLAFAGELALDGRLRPIKGAINLAILAQELGLEGIVVPQENAAEAAAVGEVPVYPADSLAAVVGFLNGQHEIEPAPVVDFDEVVAATASPIDFGDVKGQEPAKRAMAVAAAGSHNLLMIGPPGSGKTMMCQALPGIMPALTRDEALEVTRIYSSVGRVPKHQPLIAQRPVRSPHHTSSAAAVIGGGSIPKPGEVSLAHRGILFLDEMVEFPRPVLETLRQPLEDRRVTIARAHSSLSFPADFMLIGAVNPTPRGTAGSDEASRKQMERYLGRLSGPLIDRIDLHVEVPAVPHEQLSSAKRGTDSEALRGLVSQARDRQRQRHGSGLLNAGLSGRQLDQWVVLDPPAQRLLREAMTSLGLSARAYDKIRRVARTLADLEGAVQPTMAHIAEAIQYRLLDRQV